MDFFPSMFLHFMSNTAELVMRECFFPSVYIHVPLLFSPIDLMCFQGFSPQFLVISKAKIQTELREWNETK